MTSYVAQAQRAQVARRSVTRLAEAVRTGALRSLAAVDKLTGEVIDPEARALFAALPAVTPATSSDELLAHGLIEAPPAGLGGVQERPRYRAGREVFIRTSVTHKQNGAHRPVGAYASNARAAFSHRGVLRAQRGNDFLVELEGAPSLLAFPRADVFAWNEPAGISASGGTVSGVQVDYNDPRLKAFICAGYLTISTELKRLDFGAPEEVARAKQEKLIYRLAEIIDMTYPGQGDGYAGGRAGALIGGGTGVCFIQRAVAGAYLQAFSRLLAFEVQLAVGRTLRLGAPHGFVVVTLLPSLQRYVVDPAWSEPLTDLRVAFFGPSWSHDRMLEGFEGEQKLVVRPNDVDVPAVEQA
jgi:hypothetical protein